MFCVKCGNPVDSNSKFCTNCGAEIKTEVQNSNKENQTSVNNNSNNNNSKNNKGIKVGLIIFISVIVASVILFVIFFSKFIHNITKKVMINENIQSDIEKATDDLISGIHDGLNENLNKKQIGNNEFGYLSVDDNWYKYYDVDAPQVLEYTLDGNWIIFMYAQDATKVDAKAYATSVGEKMKEEGATGVTGATVKVGNYTAYQVYGYYQKEDKWLVAWCFEPGDGKSHYISIEGPDRYSNNFKIVDTFSLY